MEKQLIVYVACAATGFLFGCLFMSTDLRRNGGGFVFDISEDVTDKSKEVSKFIKSKLKEWKIEL